MILGRRRGMIVMATLMVLLTGGGVFAHMGATGIVKERMELMSAMGDCMKALKGMVMNAGEPDRAAIAREAARIAGHAKVLTVKFPEGSLQHPTDARPEIWTRWADFEAAATNLHAAADRLEKAAGSADVITLRGRFAAVGRACSACHQDFRAEN